MTSFDASVMPAVASLDEANLALASLQGLTTSIRDAVADPSLQREQDYVERVSPKIDEATRKYQALASFLQEQQTSGGDSNKAYRTVQRAFVRVMQDLQQVQRDGARRREALCDADFMSSSQISTVDIQRVKEEVVEATQIAREAVVVKELFQQVGTIVSEQGRGVEQIEAKVENIRVEIGRGVNELEHAYQLQREARQKYLYILCFVTLILAAIILPLVFTLWD
jgi:ribosomal protein S24E